MFVSTGAAITTWRA